MDNGSAIALTMGEPAGIGPDITLACWLQRAERRIPPFFCVADPQVLIDRAETIGLPVPIRISQPKDATEAFPRALPVLPLAQSVVPGVGELKRQNAHAVIRSIREAVACIQAGRARAVVTNPIHKKSVYSAGFHHPGQTEFLGELAAQWPGVDPNPIMMLVGPNLKVVPATIHIPLADVKGALTTDRVVNVMRVVTAEMRARFGIDRPRLAVCGLNPHAGEDGALGKEDTDIILPAIKIALLEGIDAVGPLAADTMFHAAARETYDVAIAMYHDQALIPAKTLAFDEAVNLTLGLPFIRTSPDHGTALDIAGSGDARPDSLAAALRLADQLTNAH